MRSRYSCPCPAVPQISHILSPCPVHSPQEEASIGSRSAESTTIAAGEREKSSFSICPSYQCILRFRPRAIYQDVRNIKMQLKCIQNTIETQWNKLHLPYPATEFFIPVAENKRRISDCDVGTGPKVLDDGLLCSRRRFRLASVLQNGNLYRVGEAK